MVVSGRYAAVNGISALRSWSLGIASEPKALIASNTRQGAARRRGVKDATGTLAAFGGIPVVMPGEQFAFKGFTAPNDGQPNGVGPTYTMTALAASLSISWNWGAADYIGHTIQFQNDDIDGPQETEENVQDASDLEVASYNEGKITLVNLDGSDSGSGDFDEWCDLLSATLNITSAIKPYVNSCTGGWRRRTGGTIDWNLAVTFQNASKNSLPFDIGDNVRLRLWIDAERYWDLAWAHVRDFSGMTVNRETGDYVQATVNFDMNAIDETAGIGHIIKPDETTWWPFA